nr:hypothetical protein [candidate division KSB1 bacterium]
LTPSSIILEKMEDSGKNYLEFGLSLANKYKNDFLKSKLNEETRLEFERMAKKSLLDQQKLEDGDDMSFDEYLKKLE